MFAFLKHYFQKAPEEPIDETIDVSQLPLDKVTILDGDDNMAENKYPPTETAVAPKPRKRRST